MIIKLICSPFILMINGIIELLPILNFNTNSMVSLTNLIVTGMNFFPAEVWIMIIGSIIFWLTVHTIVGIYMFVLDLIPLIR